MRPVGDGETIEKLLGVYSTRDLAEQRRERALELPGFREAPNDFVIDEYEVNRDEWTTGYVTEPSG